MLTPCHRATRSHQFFAVLTHLGGRGSSGEWQFIPFTGPCGHRVVSAWHIMRPSVTPAEPLHIASHHLGPPVFQAVLIVPTSGTQTSFHGHLVPLLNQLLADLDHLIEGHDGEPLRFLSPRR